MPSHSAYLQAHHLMMPILLLDLDNTLLEYNLDAFVRKYLKALGEHIEQAPTAKVIQQVLSATQQMISKHTPDQTLEQCFDQYFYPGIGVDKETLTDRVDLFYREVYPALRGNTTPRPEAKRIVEYGFEQGMPVVVATNPLFPRTATFQRLEWADLPATRYPFRLISTYERFHYAKPQTAYYAEILAQLGWLPQPAVMVGNSLEDDILPASRLGLPVFWLDEVQTNLPAGVHPLSAAGSIDEVLPWLKRLAEAEMHQAFDTPDALLAVLGSTPAALDTFRIELDSSRWDHCPQPDGWNFGEILCHLRDVETEINWLRVQTVLNQNNPTLQGVDTESWAQERKYYLQDGSVALKEFTRARTSLLQALQSIPQAAWDQPAIHPVLGPTNLKGVVCRIAAHDRAHIQQALGSLPHVR